MNRTALLVLALLVGVACLAFSTLHSAPPADDRMLGKLEEIKAVLQASHKLQLIETHAKLFSHPIGEKCDYSAEFPKKCQALEAGAKASRAQYVDSSIQKLEAEIKEMEAALKNPDVDGETKMKQQIELGRMKETLSKYREIRAQMKDE